MEPSRDGRLLEENTTRGDSSRYHGSFGDPINGATKLRRELDPAEIARVIRIAEETFAGQFPDWRA